MTNADKPINPIFNSAGFVTTTNNISDFGVIGLTKREYFAGLAMQSLITGRVNDDRVYIASWSIAYADELLKQLGE